MLTAGAGRGRAAAARSGAAAALCQDRPHDDDAIGLAGYGFGGRIFHAPLLASAAGRRVRGGRDPLARAAGRARADHPGAPAFDSLADLAAAGADAVAISTPAATHIPLVLEAIELGLAVVSDKPFALDAAQARTAVEAAEAAGMV